MKKLILAAAAIATAACEPPAIDCEKICGPIVCSEEWYDWQPAYEVHCVPRCEEEYTAVADCLSEASRNIIDGCEFDLTCTEEQNCPSLSDTTHAREAELAEVCTARNERCGGTAGNCERFAIYNDDVIDDVIACYEGACTGLMDCAYNAIPAACPQPNWYPR